MMRGYFNFERPSSLCIRFIENASLDVLADGSSVLDHRTQASLRAIWQSQEWAACYVDAAEISEPNLIVNAVALNLALQHAPYGPGLTYTRFLDDLITVAQRKMGLLIVIDNTQLLWNERRLEVTNLIEAYLVQCHHWFESSKPCHLCFQMEQNSSVGDFFRSLGRSDH